MVIKMNKYKPIFKNYQLTKFLQIGFSLILLVLDILLMVLYPDYRNKLSENPLYFIPQLIIILFIIVNLLFLVVDLTAFRKAVQERDTLKRAAYVDELTGMPNRLSCDLVFQMYGGESAKINHVACALITISNLSATNIALGRDAGDQILIDFCNILEEVGSDYGFVGRNGGNEFLLVIENCTKEHMESFFKQLDTRLKRYNVLALNNPIEINYKYVLNDDLHADRFSAIITAAYNQLHNSDF